jgi:RNA polymerase sigma-70 factor (ECF subfamily)
VIGPSFPHVLVAAQRGDEQSFEMLWRDLQPAMLRYLQVVAPAAAEDLAADTWMRVIRELGRFVGDEPGFRAWVFTVARHRALDWHRRTRRQRIEQVPVEAADWWAAPDDPAAEALNRWSTREALALIAELPHAQAEVLALRVVDALDVAQVAHITGKTPNAVRVLSHRGLRRLASQLQSAPCSGERGMHERFRTISSDGRHPRLAVVPKTRTPHRTNDSRRRHGRPPAARPLEVVSRTVWPPSRKPTPAGPGRPGPQGVAPACQGLTDDEEGKIGLAVRLRVLDVGPELSGHRRRGSAPRTTQAHWRLR